MQFVQGKVPVPKESKGTPSKNMECDMEEVSVVHRNQEWQLQVGDSGSSPLPASYGTAKGPLNLSSVCFC